MFKIFKKQNKKDNQLPKSTQQILSETFTNLIAAFDKDAKKLSPPDFNLCLIEILEMEVNNGGFNLYFVNSYGGYIQQTIDALDTIGSKVFKEILQKAKKLYPSDSISEDRSERVELIMDSEGLFEKLDREFYAAYSKEDIHQMLLDYYNKHKK
ncbi:MAG: DMP19 family protein [Eubacteriales bacterium]